MLFIPYSFLSFFGILISIRNILFYSIYWSCNRFDFALFRNLVFFYPFQVIFFSSFFFVFAFNSCLFLLINLYAVFCISGSSECDLIFFMCALIGSTFTFELHFDVAISSGFYVSLFKLISICMYYIYFNRLTWSFIQLPTILFDLVFGIIDQWSIPFI